MYPIFIKYNRIRFGNFTFKNKILILGLLIESWRRIEVIFEIRWVIISQKILERDTRETVSIVYRKIGMQNK